MWKRCSLLALAVGMVWAATPVFEVASIKPAQSISPMELMHGNVRVGMKISGARLDIASLTLSDLVRIAYEVKTYQIVAPEWMRGGERWDILATLPTGATPEQVPAMLQTLLSERFKLVVHREKKEHAVYALVVGPGGPKMKEAAPEETPAPANPHHGPPNSMQINPDAMSIFLTAEALGPVKVLMAPTGGLRIEAEKAGMAALADILSRLVDRPVTDMTGLQGKYEIALDLTPEDMRTMATVAGFSMAGMGSGAGGPAGDNHRTDGPATGDSGTAVFASVQRLGLKLESRRAPMETIVVDSGERRPTGN